MRGGNTWPRRSGGAASRRVTVTTVASQLHHVDMQGMVEVTLLRGEALLHDLAMAVETVSTIRFDVVAGGTVIGAEPQRGESAAPPLLVG